MVFYKKKIYIHFYRKALFVKKTICNNICFKTTHSGKLTLLITQKSLNL